MTNSAVVIIGTGLAGYMLAKEFRKLDPATKLTMISQDEGGFYSKPQLSIAMSQGKTPDDIILTPASKMAADLNAEILTYTEVLSIDREQQTVIIKGRDIAADIPYDKLIIAMGAEAIHLSLAGDAIDDVLSVNNITDYRIFREKLEGKKTVAIMGMGLVGSEFANELIEQGYKVTVMAPMQHPLEGHVPATIGDVLASILQEKGVEYIFNAAATDINKTNDGYEIALDNHQTVEANLVLSAVGIRPKIQLAKDAGLTIYRGIAVDEYLQTNDDNIFAVGDCAEINGKVRQFIAPLLWQARALSKTLTGEKTAVKFPVMPIIVKTPACPMSFVLPEAGAEGEWQFEGEAPNIKAEFLDGENKLRGFVLAGDKSSERVGLVKRLS